MKEFKVEYYLESAKHSLAIWEKGVKEIEDGTFKYDGSMPESCTNALYYSKVEVYKDVIELPTGVGPRHAIYNDDNSLMYIMTEYSNEVIIAEMKTKKVIQRISTIYNYPDKTFGATLLFSKNRKYLYASNRGEDSIAKFEVLENGMLEYVNSFSCGGKHPRHMKLSPDGKYLISCNMHENNVAIIDLNKEEVILTIPFDEASGITFLDK